MKFKILKSFNYSSDGINTKYLIAGEEHEIKEDLTAGLLKEKYIATPSVMSGKNK